MYPNVRQFDSYDADKLWQNGGPYDYEEERSSLRRLALAVAIVLGLITIIGLVQIV
jgi:hypothetical protein